MNLTRRGVLDMFPVGKTVRAMDVALRRNVECYAAFLDHVYSLEARGRFVREKPDDGLHTRYRRVK